MSTKELTHDVDVSIRRGPRDHCFQNVKVAATRCQRLFGPAFVGVLVVVPEVLTVDDVGGVVVVVVVPVGKRAIAEGAPGFANPGSPGEGA